MTLLSQKEAFWTMKMSFYYIRKISIFPKGLTYDFCQNVPNNFRAYLSVKGNLVLSSRDVFVKKKLFRRYKSHFSIAEK